MDNVFPFPDLLTEYFPEPENDNVEYDDESLEPEEDWVWEDDDYEMAA